MPIVHLIDTLTEWAQKNICDHITLKVPPANEGEAVDAGYDYETAKPVAFPMYVPTSEKLPPNVRSPFPSLCVRFLTGEDTLADGDGFLDVQFVFSTWDPGTHGKDIFVPITADGKRWTVNGDTQFQRNADGWRDAWNFLDIARRAVESVTQIGGYTIDRSTPIKFGPLSEQEAIADLYPFWFAWLSFRVNYRLTRNIEEFKNFL